MTRDTLLPHFQHLQHPPLLTRGPAAPINLNGSGHYVHWGFVQVSAANAITVCVMAVLFVAALVLPFPKGRGRR